MKKFGLFIPSIIVVITFSCFQNVCGVEQEYKNEQANIHTGAAMKVFEHVASPEHVYNPAEAAALEVANGPYPQLDNAQAYSLPEFEPGNPGDGHKETPEEYGNNDQFSYGEQCKYFNGRPNSCRYGDSCRFSHGSHREVEQCKYFNGRPNSCQYGDSCRFSHDSHREVEQCKYFNGRPNSCRYGDRCRFAHRKKRTMREKRTMRDQWEESMRESERTMRAQREERTRKFAEILGMDLGQFQMKIAQKKAANMFKTRPQRLEEDNNRKQKDDNGMAERAREDFQAHRYRYNHQGDPYERNHYILHGVHGIKSESDRKSEKMKLLSAPDLSASLNRIAEQTRFYEKHGLKY